MQEKEKDIPLENESEVQEDVVEILETTESDAQEQPKVDIIKGIEMLETQLIKTEEVLAQTQKELDINKETFQRTLAEYDNFRKRTAKEKLENYQNGITTSITTLLPVLDTLEMALMTPCSDENYKKGIEMTLTVAQDALSKLGVEVIISIDNDFNPNLHSAVMQEQVEDVPAGKVIKELQKGYKLGEKVIRHATVVVSC